MCIERGQVINARFPHASGTRGKKRPVVVIQADILNKRLRHAVVAQLTTKLDDDSLDEARSDGATKRRSDEGR